MKSVAFSINSKIGFMFLAVGIMISIILTFWIGLLLFSFLLFVGCVELFIEYRECEVRVRPLMTYRGVIVSVIVYIMIIGVLWALMSYTSNIPDVDVVRKLFMG